MTEKIKLLTLGLFTATSLLLTSCEGNDIAEGSEQNTNNAAEAGVNITASNQAITRMAYSFDTDTYDYTVKWKGSTSTFRETIGLYEPGTGQSFVAKRLETEKDDILGEATFNVAKNSSSKLFDKTLNHYGIYPLTGKSYENKFGVSEPDEITLSTANQTGNIEDLQDCDYMIATGKNKLTFEHKVAFLIIKDLKVSGVSNATVTDIVIKADGMKNTATYSMTDGTFEQSETSYDGENVISLTDKFTLKDGVLTQPLAITFFPGTLSNFYLECNVNGKLYTLQFTKTNTFKEGEFYVMNAPVLTSFFTIGGTIASTVDLGIKDRNGNTVLWATHNLGACAPEGHGAYVSWGEVGTKAEGYVNGIKMLNGIAYYGPGNFNDSYYLGELPAENDATAANWGVKWRTPSEYMWSQLMDYDNCTWVIENNKGFRVTSRIKGYEGNNIFIPFCGYYDAEKSSGVRDVGDHCVYWTSTGWYGSANYADLGYKSHAIYNYSTYGGLSVRPVRVEQK